MNEKLFSPATDGFALLSPLSEAEQEIVQLKLWQLLSKQTRRFTLGDSSSVPVATAKELLQSISFTLDIYFKATGKSPRLILTEELDALLEGGLKVIETKTAACERLWQAACLSAPDIENVYFRDTLKSIGGFFNRYDYRLFAQHIPCNIDYPLCQPVPESYQGVEYVGEYLRRILAENSILRCFNRDLVVRLLTRCCPDYDDFFMNLCEPVIINGLGLALLEKPPQSLKISEDDHLQLVGLFNSLSPKRAKAALTQAAQQFCQMTAVPDQFTQEYVVLIAADLYLRITAAHKTGNLSKIFLSFD